MYEKPFENNELMHYGIFGMKWGRRRYRNPDGTLTEEGKKRYGNSTPEFERYPQGRGKLGAKPAKRVSDLDDSELDKAIKRLQMEETYANLLAKKKDRETPLMKKVVSNTLSKLGEKLTGVAIDSFVKGMTASKSDDDLDLTLTEWGKKDVDKLSAKELAACQKAYENALKISNAKKTIGESAPKTEDKPKTEEKPKTPSDPLWVRRAERRASRRDRKRT